MKLRKTMAGLGAVALLMSAYHYVADLDGAPHEPEGAVHADASRPAQQTAHTPPPQLPLSQEQRELPYQGDSDAEKAPSIHRLSTTLYMQQSVFGALPSRQSVMDIPPLFTDANGHLLQDRSAQRFIEFFLGAAREEGTDVVVGRMHELFSLMLDEPAYSEAHQLLNNYMDYRVQLDRFVSRNEILAKGDQRTAALQEALDRRKLLRRETLGDEVALAMFGDSERYEDYAVKLLQLQSDSALSESEKQSLAVQYEHELPEHLRERVAHARRLRETEASIARLKTQPNTEAEIYALRKKVYGEHYAELWAFMEDRSPEWQSRVHQFEQAKLGISNSVMLSEDQKRRQIRELRDQYFAPEEHAKLAWQTLN